MVRCCGTCGKVLDQEIYTDEPNFVKDSSGQVDLVIVLLIIHFLNFSYVVCRVDFLGCVQSRLAGNILNSIESGSSLSHERTLMKGMAFRAFLYFIDHPSNFVN